MSAGSSRLTGGSASSGLPPWVGDQASLVAPMGEGRSGGAGRCGAGGCPWVVPEASVTEAGGAKADRACATVRMTAARMGANGLAAGPASVGTVIVGLDVPAPTAIGNPRRPAGLRATVPPLAGPATGPTRSGRPGADPPSRSSTLPVGCVTVPSTGASGGSDSTGVVVAPTADTAP